MEGVYLNTKMKGDDTFRRGKPRRNETALSGDIDRTLTAYLRHFLSVWRKVLPDRSCDDFSYVSMTSDI